MAGAIGVLVVFAVSAGSYYRETRRQWLGTASTEQLLSAVRASPDDTEVLHAAARRLWERDGKPREALTLARRAVKQNPRGAETHLLMGFVALSNGLPAEALRHLETACDLNPNLVHAHSAAGAIYLDAGLCSEALAHLHRAWDPRNPSVPVRVNTVEALYQLGDYAEAERLTYDTLTHSPSVAVLPYQQLHRIYKKLGQPGRVREMMRQRVRGSYTFYASFYAELAFITLEQDDTSRGLAEARQLTKKALKVGMDDSEAYSVNGAVLARQKRHSEALVQFRRALELDPKNRRALKLLLTSLHALGRDAEAQRLVPQVKQVPSPDSVRALKEQLSTAPADPQVRLRIARRMDEAGDYLGAFQACWAEVRAGTAEQALLDLANGSLYRLIEQRKWAGL